MRKLPADLESMMGRGARAEISPDQVVAESWNTFRITLTLGRGGLAKGDSLGLVSGSHNDRWQFLFASHKWGTFAPWQAADPGAPNYVTARCVNRKTDLKISVGRYGGLKTFHNQADHLIQSFRERMRFVLEISADQALVAGDDVEITWGNTVWGSPGVRAPSLALSYYFLPFRFSSLPRLDRDLPIRQGNFECLPCVRVKGKAAVRLHVAVQPMVAVGESVALKCSAVDEYGNLDENFSGKIVIRGAGRGTRVPGPVTLGKRNHGRVELRGLRFTRSGWQSIVLQSGKIKSQPHPVLVSAEKSEDRLYFGAMHGHTLDCDATFPAKEHFEYARFVAGLDFCSCGSHAEYFGTKQAWTAYLGAATRAHAPGKFVTFYGYEWAGQGHINAYFMRESDVVNIYGKRILKGRHPKDDPPFRIARNRERDFLRLLKKLPCPTLAIAHFHARYVDPVDTDVLRLHEVYSMHQQNRKDAMLRDILARGIRVGVVACSDTHRLPLGSLCPDPDRMWNQPFFFDGLPVSQSIQKKCGLQGTFAPDLSRHSIWDAMQDRYTYGTTGARMVMLFHVNGARMGEELGVAKGTRPLIRARIGGTAPLTEVCLYRYDGQRWTMPFVRKNIPGRTLDFRYVDQPAGASLIYYLAVRQADNEQAWSSPVWVDVEA